MSDILSDLLADLFENAPCGYLILDQRYKVLRANRTLADWLGHGMSDLVSYRLHDLLTMGGQMLFESHLAPLLALNGTFEEVSLELCTRDGERIPSLCSATVADMDGERTVRLAFLRAGERRRYERELVEAKKAADQAKQEVESLLAREMETARFREQFIAVLGHDLRNPVAAIDSGASLLLRAALDDKSRGIVELMQGSVLRMRGLIDNVLDFARARLGDGLAIKVDPSKPLRPSLEQVVRELQWVQPERKIRAIFDLEGPIPVDHARLSQMLSNLLGNAVTHGAADHPIEVKATWSGTLLELSVSNGGDPIPPETMKNLFQPFFRARERSSSEGLGLGLFIAAEIARGHGATLEAKSDENETRFTFRMEASANGKGAAAPSLG